VSRLRLGLLSTAAIGGAIAGACDDAGVELVAVGSRDAARARAAAEEWKIARAHRSYEALLADPDVEAVYVALPNALHVEWSLRALAAGKHVLCEKPLGRDPGRVAGAFDAAGRAGLVLMEAGMWRHHPQTRRLVELLPELGELRTVRAAFAFRMGEGPNIRLDPALGGGALLDVGWYCVSAVRLLAGEPERVVAESLVGPTGVDVHVAALLRCGEVAGQITCGFTGRDYGLEAVGSEGTLTVADPFMIREAGIVLNGEPVAVEAASSYALQLRNFAAAVRGDAPPLLDRAESVAQARTLAALLRSAATGAPVAV
jgi:xylose dehydrogenase (NAD/NADP)